MPKNIHSNLKPRQLGVIKTENPLNLSPMSCTVPKEHFTAGGRSYCSIQGTNRTYTPKEFDVISRRLTKLEHEMEIIRLSQCLENVPPQKELSILENLYHQLDNTYSVHELCLLL